MVFIKWVQFLTQYTNLKQVCVDGKTLRGSCKDGAEVLSEAIPGHWEVENKLHWVLDVVFREDDCRSRSGFSPENFAMLR